MHVTLVLDVGVDVNEAVCVGLTVGDIAGDNVALDVTVLDSVAVAVAVTEPDCVIVGVSVGLLDGVTVIVMLAVGNGGPPSSRNAFDGNPDRNLPVPSVVKKFRPENGS